MKYVLDSNVALKWVLRESDSDKARQVRVDYQLKIHELQAPDVFPIEAAHALARSERRGIITPAQGPMFLAGILASQPQLHPYVPLLWRAYTISSQARIGVYDCLYVALETVREASTGFVGWVKPTRIGILPGGFHPPTPSNMLS